MNRRGASGASRHRGLVAGLVGTFAGTFAASNWTAHATQGAAPVQQGGAQAGAPGQTFRSGVDLVSLNVTVSENGANRYATDLEQPHFDVFEDGVKQEVTYFTRANLPVALSLLIDTSASMESRLHTAQDAAVGFAKRLRAQDLGRDVDFDSRVVVLQPFTNDVRQLEQAIRRTSAGGSTSMYNAIYIALKELKKVIATRPPMTFGARPSSCCRMARTRRASSRSKRCSIWRSGPRPPSTPSVSGRAKARRAARGFKEAEFVLKQLSHETGGRAFFPNQVERALPASTTRFPPSCRANTPSATRRRTSSGTAPGGGSSCASTGPIWWHAPNKAISRPTAKVGHTCPHVDRAPGVVSRVVHGVPVALRPPRGRRRPHRHDPAGRWRSSRTPSLSACRRWRPGTCR